MGELEDLHQQIMSCNQCDLCKQRARAVPGEGPQDTLIAFFGDTPGSQENEDGRPFTGRAGQYLRAVLQSNHLAPKDVYLSNIVRCQPTENRDPLPEEIEACWQWTSKTLRIIQPKIIVTLGKPALITLAHKFGFSKKIGQLAITKVAGKPIFVENRNFYCFPMLHPTMAVRRSDSRESFNAQMKYLKIAIPGWLERPA